MSQDKPNGRVTLRELFAQRFDALEATLEKDREAAKETADDHEDRIRSLEKRITWSNVIQGVGTLGAYLLGLVGIKQ